MELKSVIFDMDGVLINSEPMHYKACCMALKEFGFDYSYEHYKPYIGSTRARLLKCMYENYAVPVTKEEIMSIVDKYKKQIIQENGFPEIVGIPELVRGLHESGLKLAVASSSPYDYILQVTKRIGIYSCFDKIVSSESVRKPKPAPDVFIKACRMLSSKTEECLIIEDSTNGVLAAKAAGVTCIGFANPDSGDQNLSGAAMVVEGFEEIDAEFLRNVYKRSKGLPLSIAETERLLIREFTLEDMDDLYRLYEDESITAYMENLYEDRDKEKVFMKSYIEHMYGFYGYGMWAVIEKATGKLAGRAGLNNQKINGEPAIEIGYMVGVDYQRKGYATEACMVIMKFAVQRLSVKRLNALIDIQNLVSIHLAEKLGFRWVEQVMIEGETVERYVWEAS